MNNENQSERETIVIGDTGGSAITPRDEIGFRKIYENLVRDRKITTIFRPGERVCGIDKGFCGGEILNVKIIEKVGADWANLPPKTTNHSQVRVLSVLNIPIGSLTDIDFEGSSPDIFNKQSLIYNLGIIYNLPSSELTNETIITKTTFAYL